MKTIDTIEQLKEFIEFLVIPKDERFIWLSRINGDSSAKIIYCSVEKPFLSGERVTSSSYLTTNGSRSALCRIQSSLDDQSTIIELPRDWTPYLGKIVSGFKNNGTEVYGVLKEIRENDFLVFSDKTYYICKKIKPLEESEIKPQGDKTK